MGYVFVLAAAVLWGTIGPASRFALRDGVQPQELAFWRAVIATVCYGTHAVIIRRTRIARGDLPVVLGFGLVGIALLFTAYFHAVETGGAALASVLLYTAPVWVALLSAAFLHEHMGARKIIAIALAIGGVAGIAAFSGGGGARLSGAALGWGLLSSWAYALYYLFGKRYFERYATATVFMYALPTGALALLPLVRFTHKTPAAWAAIVFLAVVPTYAAYLLYGAAIRRIEATRAATVATLEPVVAAVAAYLVWGERLSPTGYLFAALVVAAVVVMVTGDGPRGAAPPAATEGL